MLFSMTDEENHHLLKFVINACIRKLTPRQREIVTSHFWEGKTIAEIVAHMGVSKQYVYKTMNMALLKIKTNLTSASFHRQVMAFKGMIDNLG